MKKKRRLNQGEGATVTIARRERLTFRDIERLMQSANTYERRGGKLKQRRRARDI
ncbi:hypothetical protein GCM10025857_34080 [Alicyclobacillus contaminans]|uniref:hypothetical protein n=1 Tax=Alicyclobacillus contaminans TaxID=392016 RepID=UPI0004037591|nr:hypothetical protein [Alicyclobacillus contaminans]GMA52051.1 hypothetical protein GCM10025857_34080 [Alicyclobacillus contaminans]